MQSILNVEQTHRKHTLGFCCVKILALCVERGRGGVLTLTPAAPGIRPPGVSPVADSQETSAPPFPAPPLRAPSFDENIGVGGWVFLAFVYLTMAHLRWLLTKQQCELVAVLELGEILYVYLTNDAAPWLAAICGRIGASALGSRTTACLLVNSDTCPPFRR